ncbi:MAG: DUF4013 domain-containing protein, partial [Verrucomicrobiota bacterium]
MPVCITGMGDAKMPTFEEVCERLFEDRRWPQKLAVGGVISFVPILNLVALGYLLRFQVQARRSGNFHMPDWANWGTLFVDGLKVLAIQAAF